MLPMFLTQLEKNGLCLAKWTKSESQPWWCARIDPSHHCQWQNVKGVQVRWLTSTTKLY